MDILKRLRELEGKELCQPGHCNRCDTEFHEEVGPHLTALLDVCEAARELMSSYQFLYRGEGGLVGCPPKEIFTIDVGAKLRDALARLEGE